MAVSWGQRRALGKRYSIDPALLYELERLEQEYGLIPGREARGMQARQFVESLAQQREQFEKSQAQGESQYARSLASTTASQAQQGKQFTQSQAQGESQYARSLASTTASQAQQREQFIKSLAQQGEQFTQSQAQGESQYARGLASATEEAGLNRELQQKGLKAQTTMGMVGALGNIATAAPLIYYGGKAAGLWGAKAAIGATIPVTTAAATVPATTAATTAAATGIGATIPVTTAAATGTGGLWATAATAAPYVALYEGVRQTGKIGADKGWFGSDVGTVLQTPVTGALNLSTKYLGNLTGIKEISNVGREVSRVEEQIAHGVESVVGSIFKTITGGKCIIVTACTSRHSPEVEITRQYRARFLDADQLRGYYALADKITPILERNEKTRKHVKKILVDSLVDYGEYRLGLKKELPELSSILVSKLFLATIKTIGMILPQYVRKNGEVY
jgi:hypothetical protein